MHEPLESVSPFEKNVSYLVVKHFVKIISTHSQKAVMIFSVAKWLKQIENRVSLVSDGYKFSHSNVSYMNKAYIKMPSASSMPSANENLSLKYVDCECLQNPVFK